MADTDEQTPTRFALERTHGYGQDLDWLPPRLRALRAFRWIFAGAVLSIFIGIGILGGWRHGMGGLMYSVGMLVTAAWYGGDRVTRSLVRRRLDRLARGLGDLRMLSGEEDGAAVQVHGRIKALSTIPSLVGPEQKSGVFRRFVWKSSEQHRVVHEAGVDFQLVDESGERITVLVEGARLLAPDPAIAALGAQMLDVVAALPLPQASRNALDTLLKRRAKGKSVPALRGGELLLGEGDEVFVVGCKTRVIDPTVMRLERETPMRATLRSGREMPLLIALVTDDDRKRLASGRTEQPRLPAHDA